MKTKMADWIQRAQETEEQVLATWLSLLRVAEQSEDEDPARVWLIAKCQHRLGWSAKARATLESIARPSDPDLTLLLARLDFEIEPTDAKASRIAEAIRERRRSEQG